MNPRQSWRTIVISIVFVFATAWFANAQLVINNAVTASNAVQNTLLGTGVTATNITFQGSNQQVGSFVCTNCGLGIGNGVVIGTGNVNAAAGPNNTGASSLGPPNTTDNVSDIDLAQLSGMALNNTAVLQFDFIPTGDSLFFKYVFGSEEYPEWVGSINDAFGFFLSGPGITGPYTGNARNIALIPNTNTSIAINNVNATTNSQYYVSNTNNVANIQADGFTTVLTAFSLVQCGQPYHIKIAIGDASDGAYDSWVFLEAGSFHSNELQVDFTAPNLGPASGGLYEGCDPAHISFTRSGNLNIQQAYDLTFTGTAVNGVDFQTIVPQIVFPANVSTVTIDLIAIQDAVLEGLETFTLTVLNNGCGNMDASIEVAISDLPALEVVTPNVNINCGEQALLEPLVSGGLGNYHFLWSNGFTGTQQSTYPTQNTSYSFTVSDTCGVTPVNGVINVVFVTNPPLIVNLGPDIISTCLDQVTIEPVVSGGFGDYSYTWTSAGVALATTPTVSFMQSTTQNIGLTVTDICGVAANDLVLVTYPPVPVIVDLGTDITATCLDQNVLIPLVSGGTGEHTYSWTSGTANLGSATQLSMQVNQNTNVTLAVTDECGSTGTDVVTINIPAAPVSVNLGNDLTVNCLVQSILVPTVSGGVGNYAYQWNNGTANLGVNSQLTMQVGQTTNVNLAVTDQCGNVGNDLIVLNVPPAPVSVDLGSDLTVSCLDQSVLVPIISGGFGNYSYAWNSQSSNLGTAPQITYQTVVNANVSLVVNDQCGNTASDMIAFVVPQMAMSADIGNDIVVQCIDQVSLNGYPFGGVGNYTYSWQVNGENSGSQATFNHYYLQNSSVVFTVSDQCGNSVSDMLQVSVPAVAVTVDAGADVVTNCITQTPLVAIASGGVGNFTYQWASNTGVFSGAANTVYSSQENVNISLTVTDQCGNTASDQMQIMIPPVPVTATTSGDKSICVNDAVMISGSSTGGVGGMTYEWEGISGGNATTTVAPQSSTQYTFIARDQCGNVGTAQLLIRVLDVNPNFTATFLDDFTVSFVNTTPDANFFQWEFSDGTISFEENPVHIFNSVENWTVTLSAWADSGCVRRIGQEYHPLGALYVPNSFTPDNDGINDFFFVLGHDLKFFEMTIFSKWGDIVFHSKDIAIPWDGSVRNGGYYLQDGVYPFTIVAIDERDKIIERNGAVTILR